MNTLHLTLNKHWFDMIANGIKKEEYREIKPYWAKRLIDIIGPPEEEKGENKLIADDIVFDLLNRHPLQDVVMGYYSKLKDIDIVEARNGYGKSAPVLRWVHMGIRIGTPNPEWCNLEFHGKTFFILQIGELI